MPRWLVRFGYDGAGFSGWARQPGTRTIEGTLLGGIRRFGLAHDAEELRLEVASRTDRGVSARANALVLDVDLDAEPLLRALNGISPEIWFSAARPAESGFRIRHALRRIYRYFEPVSAAPTDAWRAAAGLFVGRVDVRSFGRGIPSARPAWREVEAVEVVAEPGRLIVEVSAPAFVWGMVRKMVGAIREVGQGRLALSRLEAAICGKLRLTLPMAEPEGLVLWEVQYPLPWETWWRGPNRHQVNFVEERRRDLLQRAMVLRALSEGERSSEAPQLGNG